MKCSACGTAVGPGEGFCSECGLAYVPATQTTPPPPPAPPVGSNNQTIHGPAPAAPPEDQLLPRTAEASADPSATEAVVPHPPLLPDEHTTEILPPLSPPAPPAPSARIDPLPAPAGPDMGGHGSSGWHMPTAPYPNTAYEVQNVFDTDPQDEHVLPAERHDRGLKRGLIALSALLVLALIGGAAWIWGPLRDLVPAAAIPLGSPSATETASPSAVANSQPPAPATNSSTASTADAEETQTPTSISLSGFGSESYVRDGFIVYPDSDAFAVHVPGERIARTFPLPVAPDGLEIVGQSENVGGSGKEPVLGVLMETRTPADGLEPEEFTTLLRTYGSNSTAPLAESTLPEIDHETFPAVSVHGSSDGGIILVADSYDEPLVRFYAADSLEHVGEAVGEYAVHSGTTVVLTDGSDLCQMTGWSATTGQQLWSQDFSGGQQYASCSVESPAHSPQLIVRVNGDEEYVVVADVNSGATQGPQLSGANSVIFDPVENLAAVTFDTWSDEKLPALRVYDTNSWESILEVTSDQGEALDLETFFLYGARLYIANTDEQPVLDAKTGEKLSSTWSMRPVTPVSEDWTLVTTDDGEFSLEPHEEGNYPGPWW